MKKFIYLGAVLIVGSALMVSCSKKDIFEPNVSESTPAPRQKIVTDRPRFEDKGGDNYGCYEENGCCLPEVVINGNKEPLRHVFTIIDNGNNTAISNSFESNMELLVKFIRTETVKDVIDNNLEVKHKYNQTQEMHYLLFNKGGKLHSVYPITLR